MDSWYKKLVLEHDSDAERTFRERGQRREILFANCEGLVRNTEFTGCMKSLLHTLQQAYQYPVDIEFTINGTDTGEFVFNLFLWVFSFGMPVFIVFIIGYNFKVSKSAAWITIIVSYVVDCIWTFLPMEKILHLPVLPWAGPGQKILTM